MMTVTCGSSANGTECECLKLSNCADCAENNNCNWDGGVCQSAPEGIASKTKAIQKMECQAEAGNCEFFRALDTFRPCEDKYAIKIALQYCELGRKNSAGFNAAGKTWFDDTQKCLMRALIPSVSTPTTCASLRRNAFATYPSCVVDSGYCTKIYADAANYAHAGDFSRFTDLAAGVTAGIWCSFVPIINATEPSR
jgi:hypothetical protein